MKLSQCKKGEVVQVIESDSPGLWDNLVGHIVDLKFNTFTKLAYSHDLSNKDLVTRTVPLVRFPNGEEITFHPNRLRLYKD